MILKESGKDKTNKGRMTWEIYELRVPRILIMGIYRPANGGEHKKNAQFYKEEVVEVLETETYDNVIMAGDWDVFLNPTMDQKHYRNQKNTGLKQGKP